jgi:hypothetical protein
MAKLSSKSFTAVNTFSTPIHLKQGQSYYYSVSGTFVATIRLEKSEDGGRSWVKIQDFTAASLGSLLAESPDRQDRLYRLNCIAFTSGTAVTVLNSGNLGQRLVIPAGVGAKVGATAGWLVNEASNSPLARCQDGTTGATLVIPVHGLKLGDRINGFHLIGQVTILDPVTLDCSLRKQMAAQADVSDALIASMAQLAISDNSVALSAINTSSPDFNCVIADGETYYFLIAASVASDSSVNLQGVALFVDVA